MLFSVIFGGVVFGYAGYAMYRSVKKSKEGKCASCAAAKTCPSAACHSPNQSVKLS